MFYCMLISMKCGGGEGAHTFLLCSHCHVLQFSTLVFGESISGLGLPFAFHMILRTPLVLLLFCPSPFHHPKWCPISSLTLLRFTWSLLFCFCFAPLLFTTENDVQYHPWPLFDSHELAKVTCLASLLLLSFSPAKMMSNIILNLFEIHRIWRKPLVLMMSLFTWAIM